MSDFDILNAGSKKSFLASLNKRKTFGLDDSDSSEDEGSNNRKRQAKHVHEDPHVQRAIMQDKAIKQLEQPLPQTENISNIPQQPAMTRKPTRFSGKENVSFENAFEPMSQKTEIAKPNLPNVETPTSSNRGNFTSSNRENPTLFHRGDTALLNTDEPSSWSDTNDFSTNAETSVMLISDGESEEVEESLDVGIEDLDPDLAALLKESKEAVFEPQKITVKLQYVLPKQPVSGALDAIVEKLLKPMKVISMNDEQFDKILTIFCNHKKLKKSEVVLSYKDDKVFLKGTPVGVGMFGPETHIMYVYPVNTWEEKLKNEEKIKSEIRSKLNQEEEEKYTDMAEEDNKMIIKLRGKDKKEISVRVKPSTLLSAVTEMYKKITKVNGDVQLNFEGERLDLSSTVIDTDLESEDLLEVSIKNE